MAYKTNYGMTKSSTDRTQKDESKGLALEVEPKDKVDEVQGEEGLSD